MTENQGMFSKFTHKLRKWCGLPERVVPTDLPEHLKTGLWGEKVAEAHLIGKGYQLLARRLMVGKDEIDLLMRDGKTMVFVEVKTRKSEEFRRPRSAVNAAKRKKLSRAAIRHLKRVRPRPRFIRFDVVEVLGTPDSPTRPEIRHQEAAFKLSRPFAYRGQ